VRTPSQRAVVPAACRCPRRLRQRFRCARWPAARLRTNDPCEQGVAVRISGTAVGLDRQPPARRKSGLFEDVPEARPESCIHSCAGAEIEDAHPLAKTRPRPAGRGLAQRARALARSGAQVGLMAKLEPAARHATATLHLIGPDPQASGVIAEHWPRVLGHRGCVLLDLLNTHSAGKGPLDVDPQFIEARALSAWRG
jgi:hypothetical protein